MFSMAYKSPCHSDTAVAGPQGRESMWSETPIRLPDSPASLP